jgi:hypothetical protein
MEYDGETSLSFCLTPLVFVGVAFFFGHMIIELMVLNFFLSYPY